MINLRKNREMLRSALVASALFSVVLGGVACNNGASDSPASTGSSDAKMATDKMAEAEPLYEGREDMTKARIAVTALRQAHAADYGNYEAAWKLARAAFYVGDRTDNDTERDAMFKEGTDAGQGRRSVTAEQARWAFLARRKLRRQRRTQHAFEPLELSGHQGRDGGGAEARRGLSGLQCLPGIGTTIPASAAKCLVAIRRRRLSISRRAVKLNPTNTLMRSELAAAYEAIDRKAEAKKQIDTLMSTTPDPKYVAEHKQAVENAKKLLTKLTANTRTRINPWL